MDFVKKDNEIAVMKQAGRVLGNILEDIKKAIKPGVSTMDLENLFINKCREYGVNPSCKGYSPNGMIPFPTGLCVSINDQSVHCFPKKETVINDGDVITVDTVIEKGGLNVDAAFSMAVGGAENIVKKNLVETARKALHETISEVRAGAKIGRISHKMEKIVKSAGFNVLKDYAGHGIGKNMHEYPEIPCYGNKNEGPKLQAGMTICIEALVCTGNDSVINDSLWETRMADGGFFAQAEHTILVTKDGYEILTLPENK